MIDSLKLNRINKILFMVFLIIQPILELFESFFGDAKYTIAGVSFAVVLRYSMFLVLSVLVVLANYKLKSTKLFIGYILLCGVFVLLQYINLKDFDVSVHDGSMQKNILQCIWYAARFAIAIGVIFFTYILDLNYREFKIAVVGVVLFVALNILITNLFSVDYISYNYGSKEPTDGSVLSWFTSEINMDNWKRYTSRGLYSSGNSLAAFFSLLLPVTAYIAVFEKKIWGYVLVFLQMLVMIMVGTRISAYGAILIFGMIICIWLFDLVFYKKKIQIKNIISILVVLGVLGSFFAVSPFMLRMKSGEAFNTNYTENEQNTVVSTPSSQNESVSSTQSSTTSSVTSSSVDEQPPTQQPPVQEEEKGPTLEEKQAFIKKNHYVHYIPYSYISELYDYKEHTDFWYDLMTKVEFSKRNNGRKIKVLILEDIVKNKGDVLDRVVGIGGISIYPETDMASIYYYHGIVGVVLFLLPYILILFLAIISVFVQLFNRKFDPFSYILILSLGFILITSCFSGHTITFAYINIFIGLVSGMLMSILIKNYANARKS